MLLAAREEDLVGDRPAERPDAPAAEVLELAEPLPVGRAHRQDLAELEVGDRDREHGPARRRVLDAAHADLEVAALDRLVDGGEGDLHEPARRPSRRASSSRRPRRRSRGPSPGPSGRPRRTERPLPRRRPSEPEGSARARGGARQRRGRRERARRRPGSRRAESGSERAQAPPHADRPLVRERLPLERRAVPPTRRTTVEPSSKAPRSSPASAGSDSHLEAALPRQRAPREPARVDHDAADVRRGDHHDPDDEPFASSGPLADPPGPPIAHVEPGDVGGGGLVHGPELALVPPHRHAARPRRGRGSGGSRGEPGRASRTPRRGTTRRAARPEGAPRAVYGSPLAWISVPLVDRGPPPISAPSTGELTPPGAAGLLRARAPAGAAA